MSNAVAKIHQSNSFPSLQMDEAELMDVLQNSVYPGAQASSIKLVINACRASGKDPLKKPYHIVPMSVSTGEKDNNGWDIKKMRDVVMPGINDYRTDAARTGQHAGTTEPEFGPDVYEQLDGVGITYPQWCRVIVKRQLSNGQVAEFSAREFWKENYATKSNKSPAPNAMWKKRPYAQLAKCAEAQALRKGFPEVGSQPTADEMEGKEIDMGSINRDTGEVTKGKPELPAYTAEQMDSNVDAWRAAVISSKTTPGRIIAMVSSKYTLTEDQTKTIKDLMVVDADFVNEMENAE